MQISTFGTEFWNTKCGLYTYNVGSDKNCHIFLMKQVQERVIKWVFGEFYIILWKKLHNFVLYAEYQYLFITWQNLITWI